MSENIFISPENLAYVYKKVKDETANNELSNVDNAIFRQKAEAAGVGTTPDYGNNDIYATKTEVANTYVTKDELNAKVSSVYKYKGNVENYESLPVNPNNGDVYNVVNGKIEEVHGLVVTRIYNTGYGSYIEDEYTYMYVDELDKFTVGERVYVFNETGDCLGNFIVESSSNTEIGEQMISNLGLYNICDAIMREQGEYFGSYCDYEVNKKYYFSNIKPTSHDSKVLFSINPGANVAWTGTEWDILGGTVDLSNYVTKDEIVNIDTGLREASFEEIDIALGDMENTYTQMLNLTNQIINGQNELIGGEA